jgi:hypothetical protein
MSLAQYGLAGALLLNLSGVLGLKLVVGTRSGSSATLQDIDGFLAVGGGVGSLAAMVFFLQIFSIHGIIFWLLSCIGFASAAWDHDENTCVLLGFVSLIVGVVLLFVGLAAVTFGA